MLIECSSNADRMLIVCSIRRTPHEKATKSPYRFYIPSAQGLLIYDHSNRPWNEVKPMFMGL